MIATPYLPPSRMLTASLCHCRSAAAAAVRRPCRRSLSSAGVGRPKVVRTDAEQCVPGLMEGLAARGCELVELPEVGTTEAALAEAVAGATVLLHCYTPVTRKVFEAGAPTLRAVVKYGVGVDAIDFAAARDHGVAVANIPEYGEETVAEGAFYLLISLAKKSKRVQSAMVSEECWAWPTDHFLGSDLAGKRLAMLGNGRIGQAMARMARGFRMELSCFDPYVSKEDMAAQGIAKVDSLAELCSGADALSIHTVLNDETRGIIGSAELAALPEHAVVVNVSRGPIIDEEALALAVEEERIGGIGVDVFGQEPLDRESHPFARLIDDDRCIFTPHLAFWTAEARERLEAEALERCIEALEGEPLTVLSHDPRLVAQASDGGAAKVRLGGVSSASGRWVTPPEAS